MTQGGKSCYADLYPRNATLPARLIDDHQRGDSEGLARVVWCVWFC